MKNEEEENPRKKKVLKFVIIILLLCTAMLFLMLSPIFNIKNIIITGTKRTTTSQIQNQSQLQIGQNIFQFSKIKVINDLEEIPYISSVKIKRTLPNTVTINVTEKTPTFALPLENSYIYIDNQGYVLEISSTNMELPILTSLNTNATILKPGDRIQNEDLSKLERAITIMNAANSNDIANKILKIELKSLSNHIITMTDNKIVHLGDLNNINVKMLYLQEILEKEVGIEGEIFFVGENKEIFFRENIKGEEIINNEQEGD